MTADTTAPEEEPEPVEDDAPPSRAAGVLVALILSAAAVLTLWAVVRAAPYTAYLVVGVLGDRAWLQARTWAQKRHRDDDQEQQDAAPPDPGEALRALSAGGQHHVLLTALQKPLGAPDTKAVRALLKAAGIRARSGVRTPAGNGPGVHTDDIPSAPLGPSTEHAEGCCCRSTNNTNGNNDAEDPAQKGLSVEAIGHAGTLVRDPSETQQRRTDLSTVVDRLFAAADRMHKSTPKGGE
ncbi:MAG: hypothetical protein LBV60_01620 [Streptomyces sp.]|jgi:hypothetical protein|nr:hypothetical protein [Streptomyces sp.]